MNKNIFQNKIPLVIIIVVIAFIAGLAGQLVSNYFFNDLSYLGNLEVPSNNQVGSREVIIQEARNVVVQQDERVTQVKDQVTSSIYNVYRKRVGTVSSVDQLYAPSDFVSVALSVTSDGWLVTKYDSDYAAQNLVVARGRQVIAVSRVVTDPATLLRFLKVEGESLPVIQFASREKIKSGQSVIQLDTLNDSVLVNNIANNSFRQINGRYDYVRRIEDYDQRLLLSNEIESKMIGSPILDLNGQAVGVVLTPQRAIKIHYVNFLLKSLLKEGEIQKPYLGISYLDLSEVTGLPDQAKTGVLVTNGGNSQLLAGDIITEVESIATSADQSLEDLIMDFRLGDTINFKVTRDERQINVPYTLVEK